jgi:SAM-dependent methyltransferase
MTSPGGGLRFRPDLYKGTAEYYDRFRAPYPDALFNDLRRRVPVGPTDRVVDLACGTGQIAVPLAAFAGEVWGVDQEPEFIEFGVAKTRRLGLTNVRWVTASAETVALEGTFALVTVGNAFHRLDRDAVAARLRPHLQPDGCIALLWGGTPWRGDRPWQQVLHSALEHGQDELGVRERVPAGWEAAMDRDPAKEVLGRTGYIYEGSFDFPVVERWTVESLTGCVYSTSFLSPLAVGDRAHDFESDLRRRLLECHADGVFEQTATFTYELARVA